MSAKADLASLRRRYVIVTAARNEEKYIGRVLSAVVSQTIRPLRWTIVSDGSTDQTDSIVREFALEYDFIDLLPLSVDHPHNFGAQVYAINKGLERIRSTPYEFIGNLDADISFGENYFEQLFARFDSNPLLGLAGGYISEEQNGKFKPRPYNNLRSVPHAVQLFRRECFAEIQSYVPLPYGGPDWHAEVRCRMAGWQVRSFSDLPVYHHRPTGGAESTFRSWYRQGKMDFSMGSHPVFEVAKVARRIFARPCLLGAAVRLWGYIASSCSNDPRMIDDNVVAFVRAEEMKRLRRCLSPTLFFANGRSSRSESAEQVPTP